MLNSKNQNNNQTGGGDIVGGDKKELHIHLGDNENQKQQDLPPFSRKQEFIEKYETTDFFLEHRKLKLSEIFIFPRILDNLEMNIFNEKLISIDDIQNTSKRTIIIQGNNLSGKTALAYHLFCNLKGHSLLYNGREIPQSTPERIYNKIFSEQYTGDFDEWTKKDNKYFIIDDYTHNVSQKVLTYAIEQFDKIILLVDEEEYQSFLKDNLRFKDAYLYTIQACTKNQQHELIKKWIKLTSGNEHTEEIETIINNADDRINTIIQTPDTWITTNPFYILTILQTLDTYTTQMSSQEFSNYGHCYHMLILLLLNKKGIESDEIEYCLNYLTELSHHMYCKKKEEDIFSVNDYDTFKELYKDTHFITDRVIKILENSDYTLFTTHNNEKKYTSSYIYYYFLGRYFSEILDKEIIKDLCSQLYLKENAYLTLFIIHHKKSISLIEEVLLHSMCSFDFIKPTYLTSEETKFLSNIIALIDKDDLSDGKLEQHQTDIKQSKEEIQKANTNELSKNPEYDDDIEDKDNELHQEVAKSLRILELHKQIIMTRKGALEKDKIQEIVSESITLGLRIMNFFIEGIKQYSSANSIDKKDTIAPNLIGYIFILGLIDKIVDTISPRDIRKHITDKPLYDFIIDIIKKESLSQGIELPVYDLIQYNFSLMYSPLSQQTVQDSKVYLKKYYNNKVITDMFRKITIVHLIRYNCTDMKLFQSLCDVYRVKYDRISTHKFILEQKHSNK